MLEWSDILETGIDEIDNQHKLIIKKTDELLLACKSGAGKGEAGEMIAFLADYCEEHFRGEEEIMRECEYPYILSHAREHREFRKTITGLGNDILENGITSQTVLRLNRELVDWFIEHINKTDIKMSAYLREHAAVLFS